MSFLDLLDVCEVLSPLPPSASHEIPSGHDRDEHPDGDARETSCLGFPSCPLAIERGAGCQVWPDPPVPHPLIDLEQFLYARCVPPATPSNKRCDGEVRAVSVRKLNACSGQNRFRARIGRLATPSGRGKFSGKELFEDAQSR